MREDNMYRTELLCFFRYLLFLFELDIIIISSSFLKKGIDIDV
jgi:hypothetical protein